LGFKLNDRRKRTIIELSTRWHPFRVMVGFIAAKGRKRKTRPKAGDFLHDQKQD